MEKVMKMVKVLKMTVTHGELNFISSFWIPNAANPLIAAVTGITYEVP